MSTENEILQMKIAPLADDDLKKQHEYVETLKKYKGFPPLVAAETFVQSMRDSGYKTTATALEDLADNSFEANAQRVDFIYTEKRGSGKGHKPSITNIAIIDDGHGMEPDMIRGAIVWGGTHRPNQRSGFGRYGFGLPSASVSIAETYSVYSKIAGSDWYVVHINIRSIANGELTDDRGVVISPLPESAVLPKFVLEYLGDRELESGTVVILEAPDRLTSGYRNANSFKAKMLESLGCTYRGLLRNHDIFVQGDRVTVVDPLFLDPACRFYDVNNDHVAEAIEPMRFDVKTADGTATGTVRVRFSYLHPDFIRSTDGKGHKGRLAIIKDNEGFLTVTRAGRQIDVVTRHKFPKPPGRFVTVLVPYERTWAVEVDFDPMLDEEFGVTVNKQQISISDRMWAILQDQGVPQTIATLRARAKLERDASDAEKKAGDVTTSEEVMQEAEKFTHRKPKLSMEKQQQAKDKIEKDAKQQAEETGGNVVEIAERIVVETQEKPYKVIFESLRGAPFYRADKYGAQTRLYINTAHRFCSDVYNASDATPRVRTALELLMFVLGEAEMSASGDRDMFYKGERQEWSARLDTVLKLLSDRKSVEDAQSALDAEEENAASA